MLYHWPGLPKYTCWAFPSFLPVFPGSQRPYTTLLGGRKPHGTRRWSWTKYQVTAGGHNCWIMQKPCAGNFLCKTLTRAIIQKQPNSLSAQAIGGVLWMVTDGLHWLSSHGSPCCLRLAVFSCRKMVTLLFSIWFPQVQQPHPGSHHSVSKTLPPYSNPISTIPGDFQQLISIAYFSIGLFISFLLICKCSLYIEGSVLYLPHLLVMFFQCLPEFINSMNFFYPKVLNFY